MKLGLSGSVSTRFAPLIPAQLGYFSVAAAFVCVPFAAYAANILVDTNIPDISLGDGACSLIEAINEAQMPGSSGGDCVTGDGGADTIELNAESPYLLTSLDNNTDGLNGLPSIATAITIDGNGAIIERGNSLLEPVGARDTLRIFGISQGITIHGTFFETDWYTRHIGGVRAILTDSDGTETAVLTSTIVGPPLFSATQPSSRSVQVPAPADFRWRLQMSER